jgi:hypothetical protein
MRSSRRIAPRDARTLFPQLCYTAEPAAADYVVVWGVPGAPMPYAFTVDIPMQPGGSGKDGMAADSDGPADAPASPRDVDVAVYRVEPGMDGSVVRLGLSVFGVASRDVMTQTSPAPAFEAALRYLASQAR